MSVAAKQAASATVRGVVRPPAIGYSGRGGRTCEFIEGDATAELRAGRDPHCGAPTENGEPYCAPHRAICWRGLSLLRPS